MKTLIVAAAIAFTSTAAFAQEATLLPVPVVGEVGWDVENENLGMEVGTELSIGAFGIAPSILGHYNSGDSLAWDGLKVEGTYGIGRNLTLFGNVTTNEFEYENATVGVRFNF